MKLEGQRQSNFVEQSCLVTTGNSNSLSAVNIMMISIWSCPQCGREKRKRKTNKYSLTPKWSQKYYRRWMLISIKWEVGKEVTFQLVQGGKGEREDCPDWRNSLSWVLQTGENGLGTDVGALQTFKVSNRRLVTVYVYSNASLTLWRKKNIFS